jgi:hypothetical protein
MGCFVAYDIGSIVGGELAVSNTGLGSLILALEVTQTPVPSVGSFEPYTVVESFSGLAKGDLRIALESTSLPQVDIPVFSKWWSLHYTMLLPVLTFLCAPHRTTL